MQLSEIWNSKLSWPAQELQLGLEGISLRRLEGYNKIIPKISSRGGKVKWGSEIVFRLREA